MREYGSVHTCFWSDPAIQVLPDAAKLLALYLLTGPHTNMLGCFRLPLGYIAEDLRWPSETVSQGFRELFRIGFITHDSASQWLLIHNFLKWNPIANPNQGKSIQKLVAFVPENSGVFKGLVDVLLRYGKHLEESFCNRLQTLAQRFRNQDQEQDKNQKQDQEQKPSAAPPQKIELPISAIITIPLSDNSEFSITQTQLEEWQTLYPTISVMQALRNIRSWNLANPKRRKTHKGVIKHIVNWLIREQGSGGSRSPPHATAPFSRSAALQTHNFAVAEQWLQHNHGTIINGDNSHET